MISSQLPQFLLATLLAVVALLQLTATENQPAPGYMGIWYSIGQNKGHGPKYSGGLGTYPANMVPMAKYDKQADVTWFVYGGTTSEKPNDLQIMIGAWNHKNNTVSKPFTIRDSGGFKDAHANPSMTIGGDGHIYVASATRHKFEGRLYRSLKPRDHSAFEVVYTGYMAYPQIWYHEKTGYTMLHTKYKGKSRHLHSMQSQDGRTWTDAVAYATFSGHYQNSAQLPNGMIITAFNYHPGGVDKRTNIYVMASPDGGKSWLDSRGKKLSTPLDSSNNSALALDAKSRDELVYIMDVNYTDDGRPVILYLNSKDAATGPKGDPRTWRLLTLGKKGWQEQTITNSTNNYDCGSILIEGKTWTVIGPTGAGPQELMTGGETVKWISTNSGRSWTSQALTANSTANHTYARRPVPNHPDFMVFWADADASKSGPSSLYVSGEDGKVYRLPRRMNNIWEKPELVRR